MHGNAACTSKINAGFRELILVQAVSLPAAVDAPGYFLVPYGTANNSMSKFLPKAVPLYISVTFSFPIGLIPRTHGPFNVLFSSTAGFVCMVC